MEGITAGLRWLALGLAIGLAALPGQARPERRLVFLERTPFGVQARVAPEFDYSTYLSRTYRVEGVDPAILTAVSSPQGLPVRLLGDYQDDLVRVVPPTPGQPPPVLPIAGDTRVWRGRLRGRALSPQAVELDLGRGLTETARLDFQNPGEAQEWQGLQGPFMVQATCLERGPERTLVDLHFEPWLPAPVPQGPRCLIQVSEDFLSHASTEYLTGHKSQLSFADPQGFTSFQVDSMGVTLQGCTGSQLRFYGRLSGGLKAMPLVEGEWEGLATAAFEKTHLVLSTVPGSVQLRLTRPIFMSVPRDWTEALRGFLNLVAGNLSLPVPELYRGDLLGSGILEEAQLSQCGLWAQPSGDRRTSFLAVSAPAGPGSCDVLRSQIQSPGEYCVALSEEAVNSALQHTVPAMLPLRRPVPAELQLNQPVLIFRLKLTEVEVTSLDLAFHQGVFEVKDCVVAVHWRLGPASGVEPGARLRGTAQVAGGLDPHGVLKLLVSPQVESLEFLSPHIRQQSQAEQEALRQQLIRALQSTPLELPLPPTLTAPLVSSRAILALTGVSCQQGMLLLQGRLEP